MRIRLIIFASVAVVSAAADLAPASRLSRLPLAFEKNIGQFDANVRFASRTPEFAMGLTSNGAILTLGGATASLRMVGGSPSEPEAVDRLPGETNYLIGDRSRWKTSVARYSQVRYQNVYPGIDITYYGSELKLEYDFVLQPGSDPSAIRLAYDGVDRIARNGKGDLILNIAGRQMIQRRPVAYQIAKGRRALVSVQYQLHADSGLVGLRVGPYDRSRTLIIDPVLDYGTFLGGTGLDGANSVAVDAAGNAYIAGYTRSPNLPPSAQRSPFQQSIRGSGDAFIAKLNPAGNGLVYLTYLGGTADDQAKSIAVDTAGNAYVCGVTTSADFPVKGPSTSQLAGRTDGFLSVLNSAGTDLNLSVYIGGAGDDTAKALALDPQGNIYITGSTTSTAISFITLQTPQGFNAGGSDAFLIKLRASGSLVYGTYFGGSRDENGNAIAVDAAGVAYVVGDTASTSLPGLSNKSFQTVRKGATADAFLFTLSADGTSLTYSTYLGGSSNQSAYGVALLGNFVYVTGGTNSFDFPVAGAPIQDKNRGDYDAFVTAFTGTPPVINFSTYLGGSGNDQGYAIVTDRIGNLFVAGYTSSPNFLQTLTNPRQAGGNTFLVSLGSSAAWESVFASPTARFAPVLATYFPASDPVNSVSLAVRRGPAADEIYIAGFGDSRGALPSSSSRPLYSFAGGASDAFVAKLANADVSIAIGTIGPYIGATTPGTSQILQGGDVAIPLTITNSGPFSSDNVTFSLQLPGGVTFLRCQTTAITCTAAGGAVSGTIASLAPGNSQSITLIAKTAANLGNQTFSINATLLSGTNDFNPANNTAAAAFATGGPAPFTVNPSDPYDFGPVATPGSASKDFVIEPRPNAGTVVVALALTADPGTNAGVFSFAPNTSTTVTLGSNARTVTLVYRPDSAGTQSAQIDFTSGIYTFTLILSGQGSAALRTPPTLAEVVDGAGFRPLIAANDWVTLKGSGFISPSNFPDPANPSRVWMDADFVNGLMPTSLDGISVSINGKPAYIWYISPTQINVLAPRDPFIGTVPVVLTTPTGTLSANVQKAAVAPGFFAQNRPGRDYISANAGSSAAIGVPENPAHRNQEIAIYVGGFGETNPPYPDRVGISGVVRTVATPTVTIGGQPAIVNFSGMTPGAGGLYQLNVVVPPTAPIGDQLVDVQVSGRSTQSPVYVTIAP